MKFIRHELDRLVSDWAAHPDAMERACAHNVECDERVSDERREGFERRPGAYRMVQDLRDAMIAHYKETVRLADGPPETFSSLNANAMMEDLGLEIRLVRLELIGPALSKSGLTCEDLNKALESRDRASRAQVDKFLAVFNTDEEVLRYRNPVSFAARRLHLPEVDAADWATQLRNRLGLAHYDPDFMGSVHVALMEYDAADVAVSSSDPRAGRSPFWVPTVLETGPWSHFYPTPREMTCGCPMALELIESEDDLIAELVHPRLDYRREHLTKVGTIVEPLPSVDFTEKRNLHRLALQMSANRPDFGRDL